MLFSCALILVCVVFLIYIYSLVNNYFVLSKSVKNVPGPRTVPIIGDMNLIRHRYDIISYLEGPSMRFPCFKTWLGPNLLVFVSDVVMINKILAAPQMLRRPSLMKVVGLPNGLLEIDYDVWRIHRKVINPTFNPITLKSFLPIFSTISKEMVTDLSQFVGGPDFDLFDEVFKNGLLSIMETTFGVDGMSEREKNNGPTLLKIMTDSVNQRMFNPLLLSDFIFRLTSQGRRDQAARKESYDYVNSVIDQRRALQAKTVNPNAGYKPKLFIDLLLAAGNEFGDAEIKDECYTMVVAGAETTSLSACHAILLLAMHPEVQEKLATAIVDFYSGDVVVTADNINHIEYLDMVLNETLRLLPAFPLVPREPIEDFDLGPCTLKPGTIVVLNHFRLHRDQSIWGADAEQFKPERFAPENKANLNLHAFLPFSAGKRNCIGKRYAKMLVKVMLIHLLKSYKFSTKLKLDELKLNYGLSLRLLSKHFVRIEPR